MTPEEKKKAARKELARRELARRQATPELPERPETMADKFRNVLQSAAGKIDAGVDVAGTLATSALAEPVAGLAGIVVGNTGDLSKPQTPDDRRVVIEKTRQLLTRQPKTPEGQQALQSIAEFLTPALEALETAEKAAGDFVYDKTGSPALAAAAATVPTAGVELLGLKGAGSAVKTANRVAELPGERKINRALEESAPSADDLKASSSKAFDEIDQMGVTVKGDSFAEMADGLISAMKGKGADAQVTPSAWGVIARLEADKGKPLTLSEIETLREVAKGAAGSINKREAMLGTMAVKRIDDFLETLEPDQLVTGKRSANEVGVKYKQAREKWGRYRRSEVIDEAVRMGAHYRSGFENGMRRQFSQLLKKIEQGKIHGFKDHEIAAIRSISNGTAGSNIFRLLGKVGLAEGQLGNNALMALLIGGGGYLSGQLPLALSVMGAGTVFKKLAERATRQNAHFADAIVRAGDDGRKIVETYYRFTPKKQRSADELSLLLMHQDVDLEPLKRFKLEAEAAKLARQRRAELAGLLTTGEATSRDNREQLPAQ